MDRNHFAWNAEQHVLQNALVDPENHPEWLTLFLIQHAQVHTGKMTHQETWSFEDTVLDGLDEAAACVVPAKGEQSIAWILWHLARCEDLTMNMLVAGTDQVLERQGWKEKLQTPILHSGNEMSRPEIVHFSQVIQFEYLKAYRLAVGESTRHAVCQLEPGELGQKVNSQRMEKVRALDAVLDPAILNYWSRRTIAGLLLMPPTRHCFTHLNEALRIRQELHIE